MKTEQNARKHTYFIHFNKTAALFRLPIRCGALIAGKEDVLEELDDFAKKFGLAFQI